ncbi:MAG: glycosyltransferase family 2 protein [Myxococcales bacterium]|nr:glycosyltransferase family 2 protein [Myxococcales bacterium]
MNPRVCALVPTFDNPRTVGEVSRSLRGHVEHVLVVDDGSGAEARAALDRLAQEPGIEVLRRATNGGKGAAVKQGFEHALAQGFTHALQVDADGQHAIEDVPAMLSACRGRPEALVLGAPVFDESAPAARLWGRQITTFWARVECGSGAVGDALCGFRVYPLEAAIASGTRGDHMDFDPEIAVRMAWRGAPIVHVPTRIRYRTEVEGGVSHFRLLRDNAAITRMHSRLMLEKIGRALLGRLGARR